MISFKNVSKNFKSVKVLDNVNLQINFGERIALVGSNGAGKTTLIRCLLGEYNYNGTTEIDNLETRTQRQNILTKISFVPQLPPPLKMPVSQLLNFSASVCNTDVDKMIKIAQRLGLDIEPLLQRPFVKLSGGQKQKILIAIAMGRSSKILIMDEPTANLDPAARAIFFKLLDEVHDDTIMLISSHRLDEVAALVNRVIELDQGRIVLDDRVADAIELTSNLACKISLTRAEDAFSKTLATWHFNSSNDNLIWQGQIAGPDRLKFLGILSRYAGLLAGVELKENI
jgi:ABC-2 type transport system ATP-binding protein